MNQPSAESTVHLATCLTSSCGLAHRGAEALQRMGFRGSPPPGANPAACPALPPSGTGQASPAATAEAEAAGEGTEIRSQASEAETAQALIPNDPSGINGVYDPNRFGTKKGDR